jgi:hypothetical protein
MVKEKPFEGKTIFLCEICGLGYLEREDAQKCEDWCGKNPGTCNFQVSQKAVYSGGTPIFPTESK